MERLSLPRRNYQANEVEKSPPKCRPDLPKDPLPTWVTLPMDAKLPMIPGPKKNVLLYTTNLGEKMLMSSPELDFDLSDPYSLTMSNYYKPLHDPHLRTHLDNAHMKKRLFQGGFITRDGKVICTLKEYNEYRQYLRKINLLLDKKRMEEKRGPSIRRIGRDGDKITKAREVKVKSMRERLEKQYQEEKERYMRLMAETEERRQKLREVQQSKMSEREKQLREEHDRRQALVEKKQEEDRKKKMEMLRTWLHEDKERCDLAEKRKVQRTKERQNKLSQSWDERRRLQAQRLEEEQRIRREAEMIKQRRLKERERVVNRQRRRQKAIFERMTKRKRDERERLEAEYASNIALRLEKRRKYARRRKLKMKKAGKAVDRRPMLKSNWDTTQLLLQEYSDSEVQPRSASAAEKPSMKEIDGRRVVSDMQIPPGRSLKEPKAMVSPYGIPTTARITQGFNDLLTEEKCTEGPPDADDLASALIFTNNYLATKVLYPALERHHALSSKHKKSIRFNFDVDEVSYEPYDFEYQSFVDVRGDYSEEESDEEMFEEQTGSGLLTAVDSLTRVRRMSAADQSPLAGLADILCRILDRLEKGELSQERAAKLSDVAREILMESLQGDGEGSLASILSDTSLVMQSSSTSLVAAEVVKTSMDKVQQELLKYAKENDLQDFYEWPLVEATSSELAGMSKFVAETAIAMAVESLMSCTDDILGRQGVSASDSQLHGKGRRGKDTGTRSDSKLGATRSDSTESVTCTSEFIIKILKKVIEEVNEDQNLRTPKRVSGPKTSGPASDTSLYIMKLLKKAVSEVQVELVDQNRRIFDSQTKSKTSLFVMDTLERVVKEIQRSRSPSATSLYIESLLCDFKKEVQEEKHDLSWDKSYELPAKSSISSLTSLFIRNTLSKVLHEIEDDLRSQRVESPSVTSVFADAIVKATLKKCSSAVRQEMLPSQKLTELTAAIISSQQRKEDSCPEIAVVDGEFISTRAPEFSQSYGGIATHQSAENVNLAESLIKTTLEKARESLTSGAIDAQQVIQVLSQMNASAGSETAIDVDGKAVPASHCSSKQANDFVSGTIEKTLMEIDQDLTDKDGKPTVESQVPKAFKESDIACLVQSILEKAVRELNLGLADEKAIEKMETNIRQSIEDTSGQGSAEGNSGGGEDNAGSSNHDSSERKDEGGKDEGKDDEGDEDENQGDPAPNDMDENTDEEELEEVEIQPTFHGESIEVDPKIAGKALMAIAVKDLNDMEDLKDPVPRNSFRNLMRPDISELKGIDTSSTTTVKSDLVRASMGALPSQTKLRIKSTSLFSQGFKKASSVTPSPLASKPESGTKEKPALARTTSLQTTATNPSGTSPSASPGSSPKTSKVKINKASLVGASAPRLMSPGVGRKRSPTKLSGTSVRSVTPTSSRRASPSKTGTDTAASSLNKSPSSSSKKTSDSKSTSSSSVTRKLSGAKVKQDSSATKKSKETVTQPELTKSADGSNNDFEKSDPEEKSQVEEPATSSPVTGAEEKDSKQMDSLDQDEGDAETPPEVIEVSTRNSKTKRDQPLPRESGPIEMVSSANRPSVKRSTESDPGGKSGDMTSPPNARRSQDFAPRPSSGFKKSNSSFSKKQRGSQDSVNSGQGGSKQGSTHSLSPVKGSSSADDQARETTSDSKLQSDNI